MRRPFFIAARPARHKADTERFKFTDNPKQMASIVP